MPIKNPKQPMKTIHVVAAIIYNPSRQEILIAKRPDHLHQGGLWEFPGGKIEHGETPLAALYREIEEELGIRIHTETASLFKAVSHQYPDKAVHLEFWQVVHFTGQPQGNEGQQLRWVNIAALGDYPFPAANRVIVEALCAGI
jgi:8-oxo-dGTP diphosphatase